MTRVLVVHHDIDMADQEVDSLRRRGYEVTQCAGPIGAWAGCPVLAGKECRLADEADVLVYDAWATGEPDGAQRLIEGLRDVHPDVPVVLIASGMEPDWIGDGRATASRRWSARPAASAGRPPSPPCRVGPSPS
jgi:hypothetical protein